jgi:hypothetical protein
MTAEEFTVACRRLALTQADVAAEFGLTPDIVEAFEDESMKVPRHVAQHLAWRVAVAEQQAALEASGLPTCPVANELEAAADGKDGNALLTSLEALEIHFRACSICAARREYVEQHAPPLPEMPLPLWIRGIGRIMVFIERLPPGLRPPEGDTGEGRRIGIVAAVALSAFVLVLFFVALVAQLNTTGGARSGWTEVAPLLVVPIGYFVGFYLAGWAFDLMRPLRHRFIGYVLRGGLCAGAIYGTIALLMPLFDQESRWGDAPFFVLLMGALGCLVGAGWWIKNRITGKLPRTA